MLHFDYEENLTVLPKEVQAYHGHKERLSVATSVATTGKSTCSFAIISDSVYHHSAHANFVNEKVWDWLYVNDSIHSQVTYVRNRATSQFKDRYQLYKIMKVKCPAAE